MKEKIYLIKFKLYLYGDNKYMENPRYEYKEEIYKSREKFIKAYQELKEKIENSIYYDDLKCFIGILTEIKDMDKRISQLNNIL